MLISHKHHFIFIKTRKTASTSVEIALSRFCDGKWDVVTPVLSRARSLQERAGVRPKNYMSADGKRLFQGHASATRIRNQIGRENWSTFSTICVVRNPWDRVYSQYRFRRKGGGDKSPGFDQFVREERFTDEFPMYHGEQRRLVDHVLKYENLHDDLARVMRILNLDWDGWLPHANSGDRPAGEHYSAFYTPELAQIVARKCAREIELFGYRFEPQGETTGGVSSPEMDPEPGDGTTRTTLPDYRAMNVNVLAGNACRPARNPEYKTVWHNRRLFLRQSGEGPALRMNPSAERIWRLCDGETSVEAIYAELARSLDGPAALLSTDVLQVLDNMRSQGQLIAPHLHTTPGEETRVVDLRACRIRVISNGNPERRQAMTGQLERLGLDFEFVAAVPHRRKRTSIALSHLKALTLDEVSTPVLVLEDDCRFTESISLTYRLPVSVDALYLGVSLFGSKIPGRLSRARWNNIRCVRYSPEYFRVFNMLARHAVLFVSERFRSAVIECMHEGIEALGPMFAGDAYYAMLQASHVVLTPVEPVCFQDADLDGFESATRVSLGEASI